MRCRVMVGIGIWLLLGDVTLRAMNGANDVPIVALQLSDIVYRREACRAVVKHGFAGRMPFAQTMFLYELMQSVLKCYPHVKKIDPLVMQGLEVVTVSDFEKKLAGLSISVKKAYRKEVKKRCDKLFDAVLLSGI